QGRTRPTGGGDGSDEDGEYPPRSPRGDGQGDPGQGGRQPRRRPGDRGIRVSAGVHAQRGGMMLYRLGLILLCLFAWTAPSRAAPGHYLFVFTGDQAKQGNDFLAVIDADPASASYGHLLTRVVTDQKSVSPHHTEYVMPQGGMLFANDH